jgi:uncharacterized protein (DUF2267 family)
MNYDRFAAIVQRTADAPDAATARRAVRAVLQTLSERLMAGLIKSIRAQLPDEVAKDLSLQRPHRSLDAAAFLRRVAERADSDEATAERHTTAVFVALSRALEPAYFRALLGELSEDFGPLTEQARRPANQLREFVRRVADRTGLDDEQAVAVTAAVLETLAERMVGGEVADLAEELPRDLRHALRRGTARSAGQGRKLSIDEFCTVVAERAASTPDRAREYAGAVFATIHDAVTEEEFRDLVSELPRSYVQLSHA